MSHIDIMMYGFIIAFKSKLKQLKHALKHSWEYKNSKLLYKNYLTTPLDPSLKNESNDILHAQNGVTKLPKNQI